MALEYINDKKILHRDIKTQNIFQIFNGTIKLGDFLISEILENSIKSAKRVAGRPYYMFPGVLSIINFFFTSFQFQNSKNPKNKKELK
jgi:NIMA (never in mitosis gene a)-related kinase 1/4/5